MRIFNRLKSIRHTYEMTQTEFADFLGIAYPQYNRYEKQNAQPSLLLALRMSERLNVTVNDIVYFAKDSD